MNTQVWISTGILLLCGLLGWADTPSEPSAGKPADAVEPAADKPAIVEPAAAPPGWQTTEFGEIGLFPFKTAPYPDASRAEGFRSRDQFYPVSPHYTDSTVGIAIPRGYQADRYVDLIVYFHGHSNHVARVFEKFSLLEQVAKAKRNAILVCPQGPRDAPDSGCGKLESPDGLKAFVAEVLEVLIAQKKLPADAKLRNLALAGHSGAYRVIGLCLKHGGLEESIWDVWLFDATYGQLEEFAAWMGRELRDEQSVRKLLAGADPQDLHSISPPRAISLPPRQLFSIFTEHLADENVMLMAMLQRVEAKFGVWMDSECPAALASRLPARFVYTKLAHNDVVSKNDYLRMAIEQSRAFPPIP